MPGRFIVLAFGVALAWTGTCGPALALWPLPWCFKIPPFDDTFVWYPKPTGGTQRQGSGRDTEGERTVLVSAYQDGAVLQVGFTILPKVGYVPVFGGGEVNPNTGTGGGRCFAPTLQDCGNFTFQLVDCATTAAATAAARTASSKRRVMGAEPAGK